MDPRIVEEVSRLRGDLLDSEYGIVEDLYNSLGGGCCRFVEVGCGSLGLLGRQGDRLGALKSRSIGIDVDLDGLADNSNVAHRLCASSNSLPLKSGSVDIIVSRWMFEHLEAPEEALREFARVLKTGGFLYIKTPNLWNYAMLVSWATPTFLHNMFRAATGHGDNIPTFYRANTERSLRALAARTGFTVRRVERYSYSYMYYMFNKELFVLMRSLSALMGRVTDRTQLALCCVLQKAEPQALPT